MSTADVTTTTQQPPIKYNARSKKALTERVQSLGEPEHQELFAILVRNNVPYTRNNNGVFANLKSVDDAVIDQISKFVEFSSENMKKLTEYERSLNDMSAAAAAMRRPSSSQDLAGLPGIQEDQEIQAAIVPVEEEPKPGIADPPTTNSHTATTTAQNSNSKRKPVTSFMLAKKKYAKRKPSDASATTASAKAAASANASHGLMKEDYY